MKTQKQFNKENILNAIIINLGYIGILIPFINIADKIYTITGVILIFIITVLNALQRWYNDYRFNELEKEIKELKNKHGNII